MQDRSLHPNSRILLDAWRRLSTPEWQLALNESMDAPSGLVEHIFVLQNDGQNHWTFRFAGGGLKDLLGRELQHADFMSLWSGQDRDRITFLINTVVLDQEPGIAHGAAHAEGGGKVPVELLLAPFKKPSAEGPAKRLLGLYQVLGTTHKLGGYPIRKHDLRRVSSVSRLVKRPPLRLIVSNR